jgi:ribosomal protein S18 acetylase RimI-like enzyme
MRLVLTMNIEIARKSDLSDFFIYITRQLADNGRADFPLFQPISRQNSTLSVPARQRFMMGVKTPMGQPGWRLLWLAKDKQDRIMGHIDIRPYDDDYCEHRVLLGMGVDSHYRRQGVGRKLIDHVIQYCRSHDDIDWLDLNVLSNNLAAKQLYLNKGFNICGEWVDKYRIDGDSISELSMTINTHKGL